MGKKVSLRKIAQESGYALCTVSRALNSSAPVAEYTRKKILAAAHKLGYLSLQQKQRIAIIVNDVYFNTVYDKNISTALLKAIHARGGIALILTARDMDFLSLGWIDGIISCCYDPSSERKIAKKYNLPIVCINNTSCFSENIYAVNSDDENAIRTALQLLVSNGHSKIALLELESSTASCKLRKKYYENLMRKEFFLRPRVYTTLETKVWQGVQLVANDGMTAVIIPSELQDNRCFHFCHLSGIKIPQELSLITWESPGISEFFQPPLTTMGQNFPQLAEQAVQLLEALCSQKKIKLNNCTVPYILHNRQSIENIKSQL
jgi:LacI family transcriptional regulator